MCGVKSSRALSMPHRGLCSPWIHSIISNYSGNRQKMPWSDCADARSDLGLCCPSCLKGIFLLDLAHIKQNCSLGCSQGLLLVESECIYLIYSWRYMVDRKQLPYWITWSRLLTHIHTLNGKQCRPRSVGFFRSQLIWIYTVCVNKWGSLKRQSWLNLSRSRMVKKPLPFQQLHVYVFTTLKGISVRVRSY